MMSTARVTRGALPAVGLVVAAGIRWATASRALDEVDAVYFVRGVESYAVAQMRPHFPGYPVYIWIGKGARWLVGDPLVGLHLIAVVASTLTALPLGIAAARLRARAGGSLVDVQVTGFATALLWLVVPGSWLIGTEAFSDSLALLLAAVFLLLAAPAAAGEARAAAGAGVLGGLLLGTRLAYVSLLAPLAALVPPLLGRRPGARRALLYAVAGLAGAVLPWITWQLAQEGQAFIAAGRGHLSGHFNVWGNSVWTDSQPWTRPLRFLGTLFLFGLGGGLYEPRAVRLLVSAGFAVLAVWGVWRVARAGGPERTAFALWILGYAIHTLFAHDVEFVRYSLPLAAAACVLAGVGLPRGRAGIAAGLTLAALVAAVTWPLAQEHRRTPPPEAQLADHLGPLVPERTALLIPPRWGAVTTFVGYRSPGLLVDEVTEPDIASRTAAFEGQGRTVYSLTPDPARPEEWTLVARFCRTPLFDSRSPAEVWLFRHDGGGREAGPPPPCAQSFEVR